MNIKGIASLIAVPVILALGAVTASGNASAEAMCDTVVTTLTPPSNRLLVGNSLSLGEVPAGTYEVVVQTSDLYTSGSRFDSAQGNERVYVGPLGPTNDVSDASNFETATSSLGTLVWGGGELIVRHAGNMADTTAPDGRVLHGTSAGSVKVDFVRLTSQACIEVTTTTAAPTTTVEDTTTSAADTTMVTPTSVIDPTTSSVPESTAVDTTVLGVPSTNSYPDQVETTVAPTTTDASETTFTMSFPVPSTEADTTVALTTPPTIARTTRSTLTNTTTVVNHGRLPVTGSNTLLLIEVGLGLFLPGLALNRLRRRA